MRLTNMMLLLLSISALNGCVIWDGPEPALKSNKAQADSGATNDSSFYQLTQSWRDSVADPPNPAKSAKMVDDAISVIKQNCDIYFDSAGRDQQKLIFAKDAVGAIGTVGTGALALFKSGKDIIATFGLASGGSVAAANLINQDFLYDADNINDVKTLIRKALASQGDALRKKLDLVKSKTNLGYSDGYTYAKGLDDIEDLQSICTFAGIRAQVKLAVKNGDVTTKGTNISSDLCKMPGQTCQKTADTGTAAPAPSAKPSPNIDQQQKAKKVAQAVTANPQVASSIGNQPNAASGLTAMATGKTPLIPFDTGRTASVDRNNKMASAAAKELIDAIDKESPLGLDLLNAKDTEKAVDNIKNGSAPSTNNEIEPRGNAEDVGKITIINSRPTEFNANTRLSTGVGIQ